MFNQYDHKFEVRTETNETLAVFNCRNAACEFIKSLHWWEDCHIKTIFGLKPPKRTPWYIADQFA